MLAHASATRIYLRKGRGEERVAKIHDSPNVGSSASSADSDGSEIDVSFIALSSRYPKGEFTSLHLLRQKLKMKSKLMLCL